MTNILRNDYCCVTIIASSGIPVYRTEHKALDRGRLGCPAIRTYFCTLHIGEY